MEDIELYDFTNEGISKSSAKYLQSYKIYLEQIEKEETTHKDKREAEKLYSIFSVNGGEFKFAKNSLFLFGNDSKIRTVFVRLITNQYFTNFIMGTVLVNSIILALADYSHVTRDNQLISEGIYFYHNQKYY